jgi:thymidine phosphorylase
MKTPERSKALAESLVSIGTAAGVRTEAVITAMDAPLGRAVGNALEVAECLDVLKGEGPEDVTEVSLELAARMLVLGHVAPDRASAERRLRAALASGEGLERFRRIIEGQGGDPRVVDDLRRLPSAPHRHTVKADRTGFLARIDAELVGRASVALGAGRDRVEDPVDPAVGIVVLAGRGQPVASGDGLLEVHYADAARLKAALSMLSDALSIDEAPPPAAPLIIGEVRA